MPHNLQQVQHHLQAAEAGELNLPDAEEPSLSLIGNPTSSATMLTWHHPLYVCLLTGVLAAQEVEPHAQWPAVLTAEGVHGAAAIRPGGLTTERVQATAEVIFQRPFPEGSADLSELLDILPQAPERTFFGYAGATEESPSIWWLQVPRTAPDTPPEAIIEEAKAVSTRLQKMNQEWSYQLTDGGAWMTVTICTILRCRQF